MDKNARSEILKAALAYPGAHEDQPWGETVVKVNKKIFVFLGRKNDGLSVGLKLPESAEAALMLPFVSPAGYGLARSGWISAAFAPGEEIPVPLLLEWLEESYRAVATKKLQKELDLQKSAS